MSPILNELQMTTWLKKRASFSDVYVVLQILIEIETPNKNGIAVYGVGNSWAYRDIYHFTNSIEPFDAALSKPNIDKDHEWN